MKASSSSSLLLLLCIIVFFLAAAAAWRDSDQIRLQFTECLIHHVSSLNSSKFSDHLPPISTAIYLPCSNQSSYQSILSFYMRNKRFAAASSSSATKPLLILTALHVAHVQAAVVCAKSHGLRIRIRSGGHDFEGLSYLDPASPPNSFFILDMFNLRAVDVSIPDETAWIEAGATLGEVYYRIAEKSNAHAFPGGMCPTVGVGGQIGGGGIGNLVRKYGMAADNVIDATIVDANGRLLDRATMGEPLFWAITGGGAASFGVVVAYRVRLVKVPPVVTFVALRINKTANKNDNSFTNVVHKFLHVAHKLPDDLYIKLALDIVRSGDGGAKTIRGTFMTLFLGDSNTLLSLMKQRFSELGIRKAECVEASWVQSLVLWADFPAGSSTGVLLDRRHPLPARMKRKSDFLQKPIPKQGLEFIFDKMIELEVPMLKFFTLGGVMNAFPEDAKPFPHRGGNIALVEVATNWNETGAEADEHYVNLTRKLYKDLTPFVSESRGAYLNYRDLDLGNQNGGSSGSDSQTAAAYGYKYFKNNYERLVQIKTEVDPDDFFRNEQSIPVHKSYN